MQVDWTNRIGVSLLDKAGKTLKFEEDKTRLTLEILADKVLTDMPKEIR